MGRPQAISWTTAKRVAGHISGQEPFSSSYLASSVDTDFHRLTRTAEDFIYDATGLEAAGKARIRVTDRAGWVKANVALFERVSRPLTERLQTPKTKSKVASVGKQVTGAQLGLILGWMSTRVLGQYDLMFEREVNPEEQDFLYYVVPNVMALEKRYAFPPEQFRLWIALHECTHRAQFTGVEWLPEHFRSLVTSLLSDVDTDGGQLADGLKKMLTEKNNPNSAGLMGYFATPAQQEVLEKLTGLMALLEGHADVVMTRAAGTLIPNAERFHRVMNERRTNSVGITKVFQKLLGMEAKLRQYIEGEKFVNAVEKAGGRKLFDSVWEKAENLPTSTEIRNPQAWISRMGHVPQPA